MTDNEIKKALECCRTNIMADCKRCNLRLEDGTTRPFCTTILIGNTLDLINRQKAEIERLQEDGKRLKKVQMQLDDLCIMHNIIKAEAVKEFAEELLETKFKHGNDYIIYAENVYTILKEKVGEDNG